MKKIFKLIFVLLIIILIGVTSINAVNASNGRDITAPRWSVVIADKVSIGKTITGTVVCYDLNGLSDSSISPSDFNIKGGLFIKKIKVVEVSNPVSYDGMSYTWNFKIKGILIGNASISLDVGAVVDKTGNGNLANMQRNIKVKLI